MLRASAYLIFFIPWTLTCAFLATISTYVDKGGETCNRIIVLWGKLALAVAGVKVEVEGAELVPADRPLIFMGNHQSYFDIPALLQAISQRIHWMAKEELFRYPIFGHAMYAFGNIPVNRKDSRESLKSLGKAAKLVEGGRNVLIFPEGTCSHDGSLLPFKRGGFILAAKSGAAIVPFTIAGAIDINHSDRLMVLKPGTIRIKFSQIIEIDDYARKHQLHLLERVREAIASKMEI